MKNRIATFRTITVWGEEFEHIHPSYSSAKIAADFYKKAKSICSVTKIHVKRADRAASPAKIVRIRSHDLPEEFGVA